MVDYRDVYSKYIYSDSCRLEARNNFEVNRKLCRYILANRTLGNIMFPLFTSPTFDTSTANASSDSRNCNLQRGDDCVFHIQPNTCTNEEAAGRSDSISAHRIMYLNL